jgi:phosphatidylinositol alpha-1,6-mannosyltransferase
MATFAHQVALQACRQGWEVSVLAAAMSPEDAVFDLAQPFQTMRYDEGRGKLVNIHRRTSAVRKAVKTFRPERILCLDWRKALSALRARTGLPVDFVIHATELVECQHSRLLRMLFLRTCQRCNWIFTNSKFTTQEAQRLGVPPRQLKLVYVGTDVDTFVPGDKAAAKQALGYGTRPVILTVARLVHRKGHRAALVAMARLRESIPDALYVIVGTGPLAEQLVRDVESLGLQSNVELAGFVRQEELPCYYSAADVFLMNARADSDGDVEGFGIAYLDAAAAEIPAIATACGGAAEAVVDGETGFICLPDDVEQIAEKLLLLLRDESLRLRLGKAGRRRVQDFFTWEKCVRRILVALEESNPLLREQARRRLFPQRDLLH